MVERADGSFQIVASKRDEALKHIERFEQADKIAQRLPSQLAVWAKEFADTDESHRKLVEYMNKPAMATVVAVQLSEEDHNRSPAAAVEHLFEQLEHASEETADGLSIQDAEAWAHLEEIFAAVDRAEALQDRVRQRLGEVAETLAIDDETSRRFAAVLRQQPMSVMVANELPYAEIDPGEELRAMLSEVLVQTSDNQLSVREDRAEEVAQRARELLRVCRAIRRHVVRVDELLEQLADREFVNAIGDSGRYLMLSEIHRFAESHRPDPVSLMQQEVLTETANGKLRIREDRREVVRRLVEESEQVRAESANDDF